MRKYIEPEIPKDISYRDYLIKITIFSVLSVLSFPVFIYLAIFHYENFLLIIKNAFKPSIKSNGYHKDAQLLEKIWLTNMGQIYSEIMEYQPREGLCAPTTIRIVLKSIPTISINDYPDLRKGPSVPSKVAHIIDSSGNKTKSKVVYGNEGYGEFIKAIRLCNNEKYRVSVNFLRSSLFGIPGYYIFPHNWLLGLMGGHFSPIIGYFESLNLVAVYDVNHKYSLYFVSAEDLFRAVNTFDIQSKKYRGLVVTELLD